jgi:hypothetical protein
MFIPDPNFFHPWFASNLSILIQKIVFKLSECDPGCASRIRILIFTHPGSRITDPGGQKGTGSRIRNIGQWAWFLQGLRIQICMDTLYFPSQGLEFQKITAQQNSGSRDVQLRFCTWLVLIANE